MPRTRPANYIGVPLMRLRGAVGVLAGKYLDTSSWQDFLARIAEDDKTLSGRIATAITSLDNFSDPGLASLTSSDSIDLAAFRREKTAIFWIIPSGADTRYYRGLQTIFLAQFLDGLVKESGLDCFLFLDELGNLGRIQGLGEMVSVLRKFKVGIVAALQSISQLQAIYGLYESQTILENFNTRIFYPALPLATTEQLSRTLGTIEIEEDAGDGRTIKRRHVPAAGDRCRGHGGRGGNVHSLAAREWHHVQAAGEPAKGLNQRASN